ncbi:hypothetical protein HPB50_003014 [Hyalomma asiaticum]|uniref:Uncharacterized protein n=1 Tax=Hyalomma asiaticum TaxID=266040 RepID=A0ACB7T6U5_HYAAI|nr:hypothetical protein HPB50_003014 [Hyalomma asiaticum]
MCKPSVRASVSIGILEPIWGLEVPIEVTHNEYLSPTCLSCHILSDALRPPGVPGISSCGYNKVGHPYKDWQPLQVALYPHVLRAQAIQLPPS